MYTLLLNLAVALAYFSAAIASHVLAPLAIAGIGLSAGVSLAMIFLYGPKVLPGIVVSSIVSSLLQSIALPIAILLAVRTCIEICMGAVILKKCRFSQKMNHTNDVWKLAIITEIVSAGSNVLSLSIYPQADKFFQFWQADFFGILIISPLIFSWSDYNFRKISINKYLEELVWAVGILCTSWFIFCSRTRAAYLPYPLEYIPRAFLLWAALKFGQRGVAIGNLVIAYFVFWGLSRGTGPFIQAGHLSVISAQLFILVSSLTAMLIAAYFEQKVRFSLQNQCHGCEAEEVKSSAEEISLFRSQFFASASISFREPFNLISQYARALIKLSYQYPDIQSKAYEIGNIGELLLSYADQLMDMAKIESGDITFYVQPASTEEVVQKIVEITTPLISQNSNRLECNVVNIDFFTDRGKVMQILLNLLKNATTTTTNKRILLSVQLLADEYVVFTINSIRSGMAVERLQQVFAPFTLTGLEIIMSQKLAIMMGGSLVINVLDFGVSFKLTLPLKQDGNQINN